MVFTSVILVVMEVVTLVRTLLYVTHELIWVWLKVRLMVLVVATLVAK